jgi:hypothetical protein
MGHKVHPYGFRLGVTRTWTAKWYHDKEYTDLLKEDIAIRQLVDKRLSNASVSGLELIQPVIPANSGAGPKSSSVDSGATAVT